jgi:hypothetical protein
MSALQSLLIGVLTAIMLAVGTWIGIDCYGDARYDAGHEAAIAERTKADADAVRTRAEENTAVASRQVVSNATITEKKHEEIQPVRERIVTRRVYVGSAICGDRPPAATQTESAAGGDGADSPGRLVRSDVERDLVALKLAVEEDFATGRACQAVLKDEGMVP